MLLLILPKTFWGKAIAPAVYFLNGLSIKATENTTWNDRKPNLKHIKVFGCKVFMFTKNQHRLKLDDKAMEGTFLGYNLQSKGYGIYTGGGRIKISKL